MGWGVDGGMSPHACARLAPANRQHVWYSGGGNFRERARCDIHSGRPQGHQHTGVASLLVPLWPSLLEMQRFFIADAHRGTSRPALPACRRPCGTGALNHGANSCWFSPGYMCRLNRSACRLSGVYLCIHVHTSILGRSPVNTTANGTTPCWCHGGAMLVPWWYHVCAMLVQ